MGNLTFVSQVKDKDNISLGSGYTNIAKEDENILLKYNLEDLIRKDVIESIFNPDDVLKETEIKDIFDAFEIQSNVDEEGNCDRNLVKELNELHTAGLSTPDFFTQDLRKTRFMEHFRVVEHGQKEALKFNKIQYMKCMLLYNYIKPYYQDKEDNKVDFLEQLAKRLEQTKNNGVNFYGYEVDTCITFTLLDKLRSVSPEILEQALRKIYTTVAKFKTQLVASDEYRFYTREEILNNHREYLVGIINDEGVSQDCKDLALRLILLIGNLRSSGEDYLVAYNLIQKYQMRINLNAEILLNSCFQGKEKVQNGKVASFKVNSSSSHSVTLLFEPQKSILVQKQVIFAFEPDYAYLFIKDSGLSKVGLTGAKHVSSGIVVAKNKEVSGEKDITMIYIKNELYLRDDSKFGGSPLVQLDTETLEPIKNEEYKAKLLRCKRNFNSDPWNKPLLEITDTKALENEIFKGALEEYRSVRNTPIFTDGEYICIMATYLIKHGLGTTVKDCEIEFYDPHTWEFVKSKRLIFEPEESKDISSTQKAKVAEETKSVQLFLTKPKLLIKAVIAINKTTFAIGSHGVMYMFDLTTGRRYEEVVQVPSTSGGYNPYTNKFWFLSETSKNYILKSFTINNFTKPVEENQQKHETNSGLDLISEQYRREVLEKTEPNGTDISARDMTSFVNNIFRPTQLEPQLKNVYNENIDESLYLIMYVLNQGCNNIDSVISEMNQLEPNAITEKVTLQCKLLRSESAVSLSSTFVEELVRALEIFQSFMTDPLSDKTVLQQFQFLWLIKLVNRLLQSVDN